MGQRGSLKGNKKCIELDENKNITSQDWRGAAEAALRGQHAARNA